MIKRKFLSIFLLLSLIVTNYSYATQIGTGSVSGTGIYDTSINWDGTYGGTNNASGSLNVNISATVLPTLNMQFSTNNLNFGVLSTNTSTYSLNLEVGTNASNGVNVSVTSQNGGLKNNNSNDIINNLTTDGIQESYTFESKLGNIDSSFNGFNSNNLNKTEVNNTTPVNIYTTNGPEKTQGLDDVNFEIGTHITEETPAGNYSDTLVFTVTGNF